MTGCIACRDASRKAAVAPAGGTLEAGGALEAEGRSGGGMASAAAMVDARARYRMELSALRWLSSVYQPWAGRGQGAGILTLGVTESATAWRGGQAREEPLWVPAHVESQCNSGTRVMTVLMGAWKATMSRIWRREGSPMMGLKGALWAMAAALSARRAGSVELTDQSTRACTLPVQVGQVEG